VYKLQTKALHAEFHPRGASLTRLIYKSLSRDLVLSQSDRSAPHHYANTIVGPVANRIERACFTINGTSYKLDQNEGVHCLHGGALGLSELDWQCVEISRQSIRFHVEIEDGHMGFPGPSKFDVIYTLTDDQLSVALEATSPRVNYFNLAPHVYFNLDGRKNINNHFLQINADKYLPVSHEKIPLDAPISVEKSDFDFRQPAIINDRQIDNNFCLNEKGLNAVCNLHTHDLALTVLTDQPGLQIYTNDHAARSHLAIEPQRWPNEVRRAEGEINYTSPSQIYRSNNCFKFTCLS